MCAYVCVCVCVCVCMNAYALFLPHGDSTVGVDIFHGLDVSIELRVAVQVSSTAPLETQSLITQGPTWDIQETSRSPHRGQDRGQTRTHPGANKGDIQACAASHFNQLAEPKNIRHDCVAQIHPCVYCLSECLSFCISLSVCLSVLC